MPQAIITRYHGPRNVRGSQVSASCAGGSTRMEWDDALSAEKNHRVCAVRLMMKLGWPLEGIWCTAQLPDGSVVHVPNMDTDSYVPCVWSEDYVRHYRAGRP